MAVVQVNAKARNLLYNAISGEEYERISSCDTIKEMWDKSEVTYEGTNKVKETHINMLVHDYELFQMKEGESIEEIFARFSKIIIYLKAFGKPYTSGDQHLKRLISRKQPRKKTIAFKATTDRTKNDIDDDPEALEEEIAIVSRNMDSLMRRYGNTKRGRISSRRTRQYNEQDKNDGKCYECGRYGHVQAKCPDLKRKVARGFNKNKSFGSWSDEDVSELEEIANLCFMTILENDINKLLGCWTDEVVSDDECKDENKNCFMDILDLTLKESQKLMNELKRLNMEKKDWKLKLEEHHRKSRKEKWYLDSACSSHMAGDKNLFKEVTKINGGSVKFGDDSKGKIVGTGTVPFNNNCNIIGVYLVDGLNYNLLSISQLCGSEYEVKFRKIGCAIEDDSGKIIIPGKRTSSIGGKRYAFVILDDYSFFTWVIFLSHKDEALKNFEIFCIRVEREKGYLITTIQSDHGGEFESRAFEEFYNDQGYTHNFSAPRSPQ
ncbi:uncharacterized protein LOC107832674 [Nicotiana tabacum]|uniref:Uncharacterized protein LOC107832674 n=1 Tax=Nicotiana tabacum TaxID=4097 RepID=A0AC58T4H7_TOBAC